MKVGVPVENKNFENAFSSNALTAEYGLKTLFSPS
jgi:hypothetical protein